MEGRTPDAWLAAAADPVGDGRERALEALLRRQQAAGAAAARVAGEPTLGLRVIDLADGAPHVLCAFEGPRFLCLGSDDVPATAARIVARHAAAGLLWEHVAATVDPARLGDLARAGGRLLGVTPSTEPVLTDVVQTTLQHALELAAWRESPLREVASVTQLDVAVALQERAHRAFGRFVAVTEPLVGRQDALDPDLVLALAGFERAAGAAGIAVRLAEVVGAAMPGCDAAAGEVVSAHITPLTGA